MPYDLKSTKEAARELGITPTTLLKYVKDDKFPKPLAQWRGRQKTFEWTNGLIEHYRQIIESGRRS